jgi:hypothetical protein
MRMKLRMTKASLFAIVVIGLLLLTACAPPPQERVDVEANEEQEFKVVKRFGISSGRVITQDSETGCMYIEVTEGISPYYGKDGEVVGCFDSKLNSNN